MRAFRLAFVLLLLVSLPVCAADYFVDFTGGLDSNDGLSEGAAWKTVGKVNGFSFNAGDTISFKRGEVWREQMFFPSSGASGNPIIVRPYSTGANPLINGAELVATWVNTGDELEDNFDDNDLVGWTTIGGVAAANQRLEVTIASGGGDNIQQTPTTKNEYWLFYRFQLVSGASWSSGNTMDGGGLFRTQLGIWNDAGTPRWRTRYQDDAGQNTVNTTTALTEDVWYETIQHYLGASAPAANDGVAEIWVIRSGVSTKILDQQAVDSDTLDITLVKLGNANASGGITSMTVYNDDVKLGTTPSGINLWRATLATDPLISVFFDDVRGAEKTDVGLATVNDWFWDSANSLLFAYATSDPDGLSSPGVEAPARANGIKLTDKSFVTFESVDVRHVRDGSVGGGYYVTGTSGNVILDGVKVSLSDRLGAVNIDSSGTNITVKNSTLQKQTNSNSDAGTGILVLSSGGTHFFQDNTIDNNDAYGIKIVSTPTCTVSGNTVFQNGSAGIHASQSASIGNIIEKNLVHNNGQTVADRYNIDLFKPGNDNKIRYNVTHDANFISTDGGGIRFDGDTTPFTTSGNEIHGNVVYDEGQIGISSWNMTDVSIYNNTVYNSTTYGIRIHFAHDSLVENNIIHTAGTSLIWDDETDTPTVNFNLYFPDGASAFQFDAATSNYATWRTNTGHDADSPTPADPTFTDIPTNDFTLLAGSPAIDVGLDLGATLDDLALDPVSVWPSSVSTLDQDLNGSGWEIGGFVFPAVVGGGTPVVGATPVVGGTPVVGIT